MLTWEKWQEDVLSREPKKIVVVTQRPAWNRFDWFICGVISTVVFGLICIWVQS